MSKLGTTLATVVLLVGAAACGGGSGRPSVDEVSKSLQSGKANALMGSTGSKVTDQLARCIAEAVVGSKLSDQALEALVEGNEAYKANAADTKALTSVRDGLKNCAVSAAPTAAPTP